MRLTSTRQLFLCVNILYVSIFVVPVLLMDIMKHHVLIWMSVQLTDVNSPPLSAFVQCSFRYSMPFLRLFITNVCASICFSWVATRSIRSWFWRFVARQLRLIDDRSSFSFFSLSCSTLCQCDFIVVVALFHRCYLNVLSGETLKWPSVEGNPP